MPKKSYYQLRARADKSIAARVKVAACFAGQTMGQFIRAAVEQRLGAVEAMQTSFSTSTRAGNVVPGAEKEQNLRESREFQEMRVTENGSILSPIERDAFEDEYGIEEGLGAQDIED